MQSLVDIIPLLKEAGPDAVADVAAVARRFALPGGHALFRAGDEAVALHFVVAGSLAVIHPRPEEGELIGYVRAGEPVGEMALIAGGKHTASVYALRDSELIRIDRADFERLWHAHPKLIQSLARRMLLRARQPRPDLNAAPPRVFALIALSPSVAIESISHDLMSRIVALGLKCTVLTQNDSAMPTAYFEAVEQRSDIVLFEARLQDTPWYRLVLRQADRLWMFARRDARPSVPLPFMPDQQSAARRFRLVDLVYLHEGSYDAARPRDWIEAAGAARFFRWRTSGDADRLARTIAGRSVGLALSGGGARAYAHIGVVRALREARIPIDLVGGTSMGAIVAAGVALGWSDDDLNSRIRDGFLSSNPLGDHHLPVVALTRGRLIEERLAKHFGDAMIEDMPIPFYCVSTDLVAGEQHVHRLGSVRAALRSSIALPGVVPPVASKTNVLVDGAVLNNLPTDIMQTLHHGPTIGVDVAQQGSIDPKDFIDPPNFLQWILKHGFKAPPPIVSLLMRTATLGIDPSANRERADLLIVPDLGKVEIRDWKAYDKAVIAGYEATVAALKRPEAGKLPRLG